MIIFGVHKIIQLKQSDLLLLTPPFTQLNTPYPATAYLKGFLNTKNITAFQSDLGIEVILKLFSTQGLTKLFAYAEKKGTISSENSLRIFSLNKMYVRLIDEVILFLQGKNPNLARQIASGNLLPHQLSAPLTYIDQITLPLLKISIISR